MLITRYKGRLVGIKARISPQLSPLQATRCLSNQLGQAINENFTFLKSTCIYNPHLVVHVTNPATTAEHTKAAITVITCPRAHGNKEGTDSPLEELFSNRRGQRPLSLNQLGELG